MAYGGQSVTLAWDASPAPTVTGYVVYYGTASHKYTTRIDVGTKTQATVSNLNAGSTYYFAVTDYNKAKIESTSSAEVVYLTPGALALASASNSTNSFGLKFPVVPAHWYEVQASVDLKSWTTIWQMATATSNAWVNFQDSQTKLFSKRFYRLAGHLSSALPPPVVQSVVQTGASVAVSWSAAAGQGYQVQYASSPTSTVWNNLGGVVIATNSTGAMSYLVGVGSHWSYRVVLATAVPPPMFLSTAKTNGLIKFNWSAVSGQTYQVQFTKDLNHPSWSNLGGAVIATNSTMTTTDAFGAAAQRFYRVGLLAALPPPVFLSIAKTNGTVIFSWNAVAGKQYQVQYSSQATGPNWSNLGNPVTATNSVMSGSDVIPHAVSARFYRVGMLP